MRPLTSARRAVLALALAILAGAMGAVPAPESLRFEQSTPASDFVLDFVSDFHGNLEPCG